MSIHENSFHFNQELNFHKVLTLFMNVTLIAYAQTGFI